MKNLITFTVLLINFVGNSQCLAPSNVNLINNIIFSNTAELSWTENGNATSWEIAIVPDFNVGSTIPTNGWIVASSNPFTITGIPPSFECYAFFVRSVCSSTDVSNWTGASTSGCSITAYNWFLTLSNEKDKLPNVVNDINMKIININLLFIFLRNCIFLFFIKYVYINKIMIKNIKHKTTRNITLNKVEFN